MIKMVIEFDEKDNKLNCELDITQENPTDAELTAGEYIHTALSVLFNSEISAEEIVEDYLDVPVYKRYGDTYLN